jgi:glycerophosphoryl diester phosphodiesterase
MTQDEIESLASAYGQDMGEVWEFGPKMLAEFARAILAAPVAQEPTGALIAAAEQHAAKYDGDDRQDIKTDVRNAYYQGAHWARKQPAPAQGKPKSPMLDEFLQHAKDAGITSMPITFDDEAPAQGERQPEDGMRGVKLNRVHTQVVVEFDSPAQALAYRTHLLDAMRK